jgi:hypothetical protein
MRGPARRDAERASTARRVFGPACVGAAILMCCGATAEGQILLDRVLARVNGTPVTLSDVRAGLGMGLVVAGEGEMALATEQWVQRQLLLTEVERFPPPEPPSAAVDREEALVRSRIGSSLAVLAAQTGLDDRRIRTAARDTLRIRAYLEQRFGLTAQVSDEDARAYYAAHPEEFIRDGVVVSFEAAESMVRERASEARRQAAIDRWMADLRQRANVAMPRQRP